MDTIKIARRLAELGQTADAQRAYTLALQAAGLSPEEELEAASYLLFSKGDYRVAYTSFLSLYRRGFSNGTAGADDPGLLPAQCGSSPQAV